MTTTLYDKKFEVTGAVGATFSFTSIGNVSFSNQSGIVPNDGTLYTDITFFDLEAYDYPITLLVKLTDECTETYFYTPVNPCTSLTATISQSDLTFTANPSGGSNSYTYTWTYDTTIFKTTVTNQKILALQVKDNINVPPISSISLTITDSNGCSITLNQEVNLAGPTLLSVIKNGTCDVRTSTTICGIQSKKFVTYTVEPTTGTIDNDTITVSSYDTTKYCVGRVGNVINIQTSETGTSTFSISAKDENGLDTNSAILTVIWPDCSSIEKDQAVVETRVFSDSDFTKGISIDDFTWNADKNCFEFIESNGQTLVGPHELTGKRGTYTYVNGTIFYVDGVGTDDQEIIRFSICSTTDATKKTTGELINDFEKIAAPVVADGTVCTTCDQTTSNVSVESLITGDYDISTLAITTPPSNTTVTINLNGTLNFTENTSFDAVDPMEFTVKNSDGVVSNTGTLHISRTCAGKVTNVTKNITCETKNFDLLDVLLDATDYYVGGYTWTETTGGSNTYTDQGGTIGAFSTGTVDFTGIDSGTYTFQIGGATNCVSVGGSTIITPGARSATSNVTIVLNAEETITIDSLEKSSLGGGTNQITVRYTITNYQSLNNFQILEDGVLKTLTFNQVNPNGTGIAVFSTTATGSPVVITARMTSKCSTTISDTENIILP